jgi:hypothetical protein
MLNHKRATWLLVFTLAVAAGGCDTAATKERLSQLTALSAEKDSLLALVTQSTRLMTDISLELSKVRAARRPAARPASVESPAGTGSFHDSLKTRVKDVVARVNQAESRLAASQQRIAALTSGSDSLKSQATLLEQAMADLRAGIDSQRAAIALISAEADSLKAQNAALAQRNLALADTLANLDTESNTVYYVIGTKQDLKARGIVVEEGSKFLVFGSKLLVPARGLTTEGFTAIDQRKASEIVLPDGAKSYRIVSRQNLEYLGTPTAKGGRIQGSIRITQPERFWAPSRFLIVVEG